MYCVITYYQKQQNSCLCSHRGKKINLHSVLCQDENLKSGKVSLGKITSVVQFKVHSYENWDMDREIANKQAYSRY